MAKLAEHQKNSGLKDAVVSFAELQKMVRFRAIQEGKKATPTALPSFGTRAAG